MTHTLYLPMLKKTTLFLLVLFSVGCASTTAPETQPEVFELEKQRDSLRLLQEEISEKLLQIEDKLAEMDTTKDLHLVTILPIEPDTFKHYFEVYGRVDAEKNVTLYPEASSTIESFEVKEGQRVTKGQVLVRLDTEISDRSIEEVETQFELAQTLYEKQKSLWEQNIGSEVQFLEAKNRMNSLEANLARLKEQRGKNIITAPFAGIVDEIFPKAGELATPQMPLLRIVNLDDVYIQADVIDSYLGRVKEGTPVVISLPSLGKEIHSSISQTGNYINPDNRTFRVKIELPSEENNIKPNLLASLLIQDYQKDSALVIPNRLLQQDPEGNNFVFVIEKNENNRTATVKKRMVTVGMSYKKHSEIIDGLQKEDVLVDEGSRSVNDGQIVQVVNKVS